MPATIGLTVSDAFRLMMVRIASKDKALPFEPLQRANAEPSRRHEGGEARRGCNCRLSRIRLRACMRTIKYTSRFKRVIVASREPSWKPELREILPITRRKTRLNSRNRRSSSVGRTYDRMPTKPFKLDKLLLDAVNLLADEQPLPARERRTIECHHLFRPRLAGMDRRGA